MSELSEKTFNVIEFAIKIMEEIEKVRSFEKVPDLDLEEGTKLPTETRLNAFFRLLGMPYFLSEITQDGVENLFLNSGFSKTVRSKIANKTFDNGTINYTNSNNTTDKLFIILSDRSSRLKAIEQQIGSNEMNEKMEKAIQNPLKIIPNFDGEYLPEIDSNRREVFKKLFPIIPSFPIYNKILPLENDIARPFTTSERERKVDRGIILRKPFLEEVIRIRFIEYDSANDEKDNKTEEDITGSIKNVIGEEEFKQIFGSTTKLFSKVNLIETFIIDKFLSAIKNLAREWVNINKQRIRLLREIKPTIAIKTGSARNMFGKRIEISSDYSGTIDGEKLIKINRLISRDEAILSLLPVDRNSEVRQSSTSNTTNSALQSSFTDLLTYGLERNRDAKKELISSIRKKINALEKVRLRLDLMTGEFSGISLPDIIIVLAALFVVDRTQLLNILDKYVIDDMKESKILKPVIENIEPTPENAMLAVQEIEKVISQLYSLFQSEVNKIQNRKTKGKTGLNQRR